jgi:tetraprenyl-beta-curcumene synthase
MPGATRGLLAALAALGVYRARVVPEVRRQLAEWRRAAAAIPDRALRRQALAAIDEKGLNVEAVAVFAILAPRRRRRATLRAMVALQVAIDYLDTLGEQESEDRLRDGLRLHGALVAAVTPGAPEEDWYGLHPRGEDGGYLGLLVAACQQSLRSLPGQAKVGGGLQLAARRCGEGQSRTHAAAPGNDAAAGVESLAAWAASLEAADGYRWWEVAAGASSSVGAHALIAAAADARTGAAEVKAIDAAYFPAIGALTVLLDDLIDRDSDRRDGAHNYIAYYSDQEQAGARLELLAKRARAALDAVPHRHRHAAILAGVAGSYLSDRAAETPYAAPIRARLLVTAGPAVRPIVALMRRRRG